MPIDISTVSALSYHLGSRWSCSERPTDAQKPQKEPGWRTDQVFVSRSLISSSGISSRSFPINVAAAGAPWHRAACTWATRVKGLCEFGPQNPSPPFPQSFPTLYSSAGRMFTGSVGIEHDVASFVPSATEPLMRQSLPSARAAAQRPAQLEHARQNYAEP
jgi:hypothetical protein